VAETRVLLQPNDVASIKAAMEDLRAGQPREALARLDLAIRFVLPVLASWTGLLGGAIVTHYE
jgi:hypothetical protein